MTQPYVFIEKVTSHWKKPDRLDILLLRALCLLSAQNPVQAEEGFTPQELVEQVSQLLGRPWSDSSDKGQMSSDVRRQWKNLQETWQVKEEGLLQQLKDERYQEIPRLAKTEGGGAGRISKYRIEWIKATQQSTQAAKASTHFPNSGDTLCIRYICEDIENAGLLGSIFSKGYRISGWRKWVFVAGITIPIVFLWLVLAISLYGYTHWEILGTKAVLSLFLTLIVFLVMFWRIVWPFIELPNKRIVIAPSWMQSDDNDRLLEHRYPPRYPEKSVKSVRYTSKCPICGGTISAQSGGLEFWRRIVGRCEHAPVEHVYSFDHVTRSGKLLR